MSPEQATEKPLDFRSDQFSVGLVFYEMLTRKRLFHRATPVQTLSAIIQEDPLPLEGLDSRVPPPLRWAIERCLSKDPNERYGSTVELARELKQIRDKLSDFQQAERASRRVDLAPGTPGAAGSAASPAQHTRSASTHMPSMFQPAAPNPSFMAARAPGPTPTDADPGPADSASSCSCSSSALALFACGAFLGDWFRGKQADAPPPIWKGNLLVGPMTRVMSPRSSPDGAALAFLTLVSGRSQVAVMKHTSGDWNVLTKRGDAGSVFKVCWSRDGDRLFFDRVTDVPRGIFSVPPLGGEERAVLEDAQAPEALPDGSLLVVKRDAARNFQIHRFRPDSGALTPVGPPWSRRAGTFTLRAFPDGKTALFWGRLAGSTDSARRVYELDLGSGKAKPFAPQLPLAPPLAIAADGKSVLAFVTVGDLQQSIAVTPNGEQGKILFPVTGKPWGLDSGSGGSVFVSTMDGPAELLRFSPAGGVADPLVTMAGSLVTSPVQLPDGGMLIPNQVLGRRRLLIATPDGTAQAVPRLRRAGDAAGGPRGPEPRRLPLRQRRTAVRDHDRDPARGTDRPAARGDARDHAAEPGGVARRPDALLRQRGNALRRPGGGRQAARAASRQRRRGRPARSPARRSSSRSTARRASSSSASRSTAAPSSRSSSRARCGSRRSPSRAPRWARTAASRSP